MTKPENQELEQIVLCRNWEESERGWGVRPDGISLHLTEQDYKQYVENYWSTMPDRAPDEYSRPATFGNLYEVKASDELYKEIEESKNGIRVYNTQKIITIKRVDKK
jgi:hypothetical protein